MAIAKAPPRPRKSIQDLQRDIRDLEYRRETSSMSLAAEKALRRAEIAAQPSPEPDADGED